MSMSYQLLCSDDDTFQKMFKLNIQSSESTTCQYLLAQINVGLNFSRYQNAILNWMQTSLLHERFISSVPEAPFLAASGNVYLHTWSKEASKSYASELMRARNHALSPWKLYRVHQKKCNLHSYIHSTSLVLWH